jgi:hypothetical protein
MSYRVVGGFHLSFSSFRILSEPRAKKRRGFYAAGAFSNFSIYHIFLIFAYFRVSNFGLLAFLKVDSRMNSRIFA